MEWTSYNERNNIIPDSQSGFRANRSTQDQLFRLINDAATSIGKGEHTMVTCFDIEKAYDKIWREGLALKLKMIKLPETLIALILDFLSNRQIQLKVNDV